MRKVVTHPTLLRDVVKRVNERQDSELKPLQRRLADIQKERARLSRAQEKYYRAFEKDTLDPEDLRARTAEIKEQLAALDREEKETRVKVAACESAGRVPFDAVKRILDDFVAQLQQADTTRQRALLQALVKEISFEKEKGVKSIKLHLHDDVARVLGLSPSPDLPGPVTLTV